MIASSEDSTMAASRYLELSPRDKDWSITSCFELSVLWFNMELTPEPDRLDASCIARHRIRCCFMTIGFQFYQRSPRKLPSLRQPHWPHRHYIQPLQHLPSQSGQRHRAQSPRPHPLQIVLARWHRPPQPTVSRPFCCKHLHVIIRI